MAKTKFITITLTDGRKVFYVDTKHENGNSLFIEASNFGNNFQMEVLKNKKENSDKIMVMKSHIVSYTLPTEGK